MRPIYNKAIATLLAASLGSVFGAAYLVRPDGSGNISKDEIRAALDLTDYQFQKKATSGGLTFTLNRSVNYSVPCREVGTNGPTFYYDFHAVETGIPMNAIARFNSFGKVVGFKLSRVEGVGTMEITDAGGNPVLRAHCPEGFEYTGGIDEPNGEDTIINVKKGGLVVNHTLIRG
jgi:hypothetical protein